MVDILYGYPSDERFEKADKGELAIGGCIVSDDNPSWQCTACQAQIYDAIQEDLDNSLDIYLEVAPANCAQKMNRAPS